MLTYSLLRSNADVYDVLVDEYAIDMSDYDNEHDLLDKIRSERDIYNSPENDSPDCETKAANLSGIMALIKMVTSLNIPEDNDLTFVKKSFTRHTGGNCMVDILELSDGHYVGITDEVVCLYAPDVKPEDFLYQDIGHIYIP